MKAVGSFVFRLTITAIQMIGLGIYPAGFALHSAGSVKPAGESSCLKDLAVEVTTIPSTINLGQSSIVRWSVDPAPGCVLTSVQLNERPVPPNGNEIVTPSQSTTYRVSVILDLNSSPVRKTTSVRVTVSDSVTQFFCPYLFPSQGVELAELDLQRNDKPHDLMDEWLPEPFGFTSPIIVLSPDVVPDLKRENTVDPYPARAAEIPFLSACSFMPAAPGSDLNQLLPGHRNPIATQPAA